MLGFFKSIFSTQSNIDNVLDKKDGLLVKAGGWIDGLSYTDQEKAEMTLQFTKVANDRLKALEPFKVTQRIIAFSVFLIWGITVIANIVSVFLDSFRGCDEEKTTCAATSPLLQALLFSDAVWLPVLLVLGLYFGGGSLPSIFGGFGRNSKK